MQFMKLLSPAIVVSLVGLMAHTSNAATWHVSPTGNDANDGASWATAKQTIQAGVDAAASSDTVLVNDGTYVLTEQINAYAPIIIRSVNGPGTTIVDGNGPVTSNRCFYLEADCTLDGFTVTNGHSPQGQAGGGVYCVNETVTITNCIISGNTAEEGGGGTVGGTLYNCTISGNTAWTAGGASGGVLHNCTIIENTANYGGGVFNATLENCTISRNSGEYGGGASYCTLNNCTLSGNSATMCGGGAYSLEHAYTLNNCTLSGNTAGESGGGAYYCALNNCTLSGNSAAVNGGGACYSSLNNCIVYHNPGSDIHASTVKYTCSPDAAAGSDGNITNAPLFIDANNGNYRLSAGSPCINAGHNSMAPTNITPRDLDGNLRIWDGTVDMGAYEYGSLSGPLGVSASDGACADKVRLTWNAHPNATGYEVWRNSNDNAGAASQLAAETGTIHDDTAADAGVIYYYWVKATNTAGISEFSVSDSGWRSQAAEITAQPQSLIRNEGEPASFSITATGSEPLYFQWQKDGSNISAANAATHDIAALTLGDAGEFRCIVSNLASAVTSTIASLTVIPMETAAAPAFNPDGGAHPGFSVNVTITCATDGATIHYTNNGNEPTTNSATVASGGSVSLSLPGTLKAKAWKTGMHPSAVKSARYTAAPQPPAAPVNVSASDGVFTNKLTVEWTVADGATGYRIFRHTSNHYAAAEEIGTSSRTTYDDMTARANKTYYYWVKAVNAAGASAFSTPDTGYLGVIGPLVTANGMAGDNIRIRTTDPVTIAVEMMNLPVEYLGLNIDWWVAAYVQNGGLWFYFDSAFNLTPFDGNPANCHPAYQGPLYEVPSQTLVENMLLPPGTYNVWFAVDYPMDGVLNLTPGYYLMDSVTVVVE